MTQSINLWICCTGNKYLHAACHSCHPTSNCHI